MTRSDTRSAARPAASGGRTGRPPATSRAQILTAARLIIDRDGWEKLTVRRLAAELGIGATTLYHHVRDREDLLVQLLNEHIEQTVDPDLPDDPRERIVAVGVAVRDSLAMWPWAADVLATDGFLARLGAPALRHVETILDGAVACGCTPAQSVDVFRTIWYFTVGEILVRAHSAGTPRPAPGEPFHVAGLEPSSMPRLAEVKDDWPALAARDTYPTGLRALVDGMLAEVDSPAED
ncbi:TetR/AcrR family transcriptional regulator [Streptomyces sp. NPDC052225]|uniref:TetR/AcrR family transcriptional regulator n=1 Tax=Streptomyces sp. NPDC052225 TaxID=3154949 RepID=UPI00341A656D